MAGLCVGAFLGLGLLLTSVPHYRASADVMIGGGLEGGIADQARILESATVLGTVARELELYDDPYFTRPRLVDRLADVAGTQTSLQERVLWRLSRGLDAQVLPGTGIIRLDGVFKDPALAARIVNMTVVTWRQQMMDDKFQAARQVGDVMGKQLATMQKNADAAQAALDAFRAQQVQPQAGESLVQAEPLISGQDRQKETGLEMAAASAQRLYEEYVLKYQATLAEHDVNLADLRVVSFATIPATPDVGPRLLQVMLLMLAGFMLGLIKIILGTVFARGFTSVQQLETATGYPVFASIPAAGGASGPMHHKILEDPAAILAESLRSLRISLRLRGEAGYRPRTVVFTSTLPDEGKTSLSVMLATVAAKSGERVCVVDCDLRRPSLHKAFGIGNARGLADYLSDRLSLDEVIHRRDPSGVHLITGKSIPSYSLTLLTSGRMERLIDSLREQYDLVILDAPSSLAFADARVLGGMVDQMLYVVNWNRTARHSVLASLKNYADLGYEPLALVMNKVDLGEYVRDSAAAVIYRYGHESGEPVRAHGGGLFAT